MKSFKDSVVYQIYPKSFKDSNNDGIGDLRGIIEKLDYLKVLGVDYIWLTPFYVSPQKDNGYDVADYYRIDPCFGTMEDFEQLIIEAKQRNIELMLDMVFNHTSTEHMWFKKALQGDEFYKSFYIFKEGKEGNPPTNWESKFGGSAWEYVEHLEEYYLHLYDVTQGDLNWDNQSVREEIYKIVNFWMDKGVKGFRLDVINLISKPEVFKDDFLGDGRRFYTDGPSIHTYLKELNEKTFGKYKDSVTVGEMSSTSMEQCVKYSNPNENELSMVFNFHHLKVDYDKGNKWSLMPFDFQYLKSIFKEWQEGMYQNNAWSALFWCNHDQPRIVSRFGDDQLYHQESAKMLGTAIHLMRGTPYIYQGEEFGMTNPYFNKIEDYRDIESVNYYTILKEQGIRDEEILAILQVKSRDNSRTPMQWSEEVNAGFSKSTPWIPVGHHYKKNNAKEALENKKSIFYHYQKLIQLRKAYDIIVDGDFKMLLEEHPSVYAYIRTLENKSIVVINHFYATECEIDLLQALGAKPKYQKMLISNYENSPMINSHINLRPYESIVYYIER